MPLNGLSIALVYPRYQWLLYRQCSLGSCANFIMKVHVLTTPVMKTTGMLVHTVKNRVKVGIIQSPSVSQSRKPKKGCHKIRTDNHLNSHHILETVTRGTKTGEGGV